MSIFLRRRSLRDRRTPRPAARWQSL